MVKKCVLGFDKGRYLEKERLETQSETDLWRQVVTHFSDTSPLDLIKETSKRTYICTKSNPETCKECPAYKNRK